MTIHDTTLEAKIDLTAALCMAAQLGFQEGVCNHFSYALSASGDEGAPLINPQGVHWSAIVPSDTVTVDVDGNRLDGRRTVEPTAFFIHSCVHRAKRNARCVLHTHMPFGRSLEGGRLEWCSQNSLRYYGRVGLRQRVWRFSAGS
jgi:ribulose-5-phosphate 4-epimerase/fuculose-1-phosphate aldolase